MERWPDFENEFAIEASALAGNVEAARGLLKERGAQALVVTSGDRHLNEYTPREDNHRYYLSRFTGSTALLLVPIEGQVRLYVDGRYHLQADQEADPAVVEVIKVAFGSALESRLLDDLGDFEKVLYEGDRVSHSFAQRIEASSYSAEALLCGELVEALGRSPLRHDKPIERIPAELSGSSLADKRSMLWSGDDDGDIFLLQALDDVAWLSDCRGYHFRHQSSFAAEGFATRNAVHLTLPASLIDAPRPDLGADVVWHSEAPEDVLAKMDFAEAPTVRYDNRRTNAAFVARLEERFDDWDFESVAQSPVTTSRARKNAKEIAHFESMNSRSAEAIKKTMRWLRGECKNKKSPSELDFFLCANRSYEEVGARDLSFSTIAARGANSAIIHYSGSSADASIAPTDLVLLDSGAYYEGGFATDITRTVLAGGRRAKASAKQREVYTLVLKGLLQGMAAIFPDGAPGAHVDALCRAPLFAAGYDYAHGTGHGVGIHVHEPGTGISPSMMTPLRAGHVTSIEPGIYLAGFGGVRLENVALVEDHPEMEGFLRFRPLSWVGFDPVLIDRERLDERESQLLDDYQEECRRRGTDDLDVD